MTNWANRPGPTPGPKGVVKQHHAMASGYEIPTPKRCVKTGWEAKETGDTHVPGLGNRMKPRAK